MVSEQGGLTLIESIAAAVVLAAVIIVLSRLSSSLRRQAVDLDRTWSDLQVLLKRRSDDLPRLVQTCRSYMEEEQEILKKVMQARAASLNAKTVEKSASADAALRAALEVLLKRAVDFPELKNSAAFSRLHESLVETCERIEEGREFFNESVRRFNLRLNRPPASWLSQAMKLPHWPLFESSKAESA